MSMFRKCVTAVGVLLLLVFLAGVGKWSAQARLLKAGYKPTENELVEALENKNSSAGLVRLFLDAGVDAEDTIYDGMPLLHSLIGSNKDKIAIMLIERGFHRAEDLNGKTALMAACSNRSEGVVMELLKRGADVNAVDEGGRTALHYLFDSNGAYGAGSYLGEEFLSVGVAEQIEQHQINILRTLLEKGADPDMRDVTGVSGADCIIATGSAEQIALIQKRGTFRPVPAINGRSVLHTAVEHSNVRGIDFIVGELKGGLELVNRRDRDGVTPLMMAKNSYVLARLVKAGANINAGDQDGDTLLHYLVGSLESSGDEDGRKESYALIRAALRYGADPNRSNIAGDRPILLAAAKCDAAAAAILRHGSAKIRSMGELSAAARGGCLDNDDYRTFMKTVKAVGRE